MATGLGFAMIGLVMMAFALGAAGVAPAAPESVSAAMAIAQPLPHQTLLGYREPAKALIGEMPVP